MPNTPVLKKDLVSIHTAINRLTESNSRIERALLGDEGMEIEGMAAKVKRHDKHIAKSNQRLGLFTGISGVLGYLLNELVNFFKH